MKKRILLSTLFILLAISTVFALTSCIGGGSSENCQHEWNDIASADPDCYKEGFLHHFCLKCNKEEYLTLERTEHEAVADLGYEPTCSADGLGAGSHCKHCGEPMEEQEIIPALGHSFETVPGYKASCTEKGLSDGERCTVCGEVSVEQTEINAKGHTWATIYGYSATCTKDGLSNGVSCENCGEVDVEQQPIPATGHNYIEGSDGYESTCTQNGWTNCVYCIYCDDVKVEPEQLPLKEHSIIITKQGRDATCTKNGLTNETYCETCYSVIDEQVEIEAKGHTVVSYGKVDATCVSEGKTEGKKCDSCGVIFNAPSVVSKKPHKYLNGTCTECKLTVSVGLTFVKNDLGNGYVLVGRGDFSGNELVVPETYEGLPVLEIAEGAFENDTLTSVKVVGEITTIQKDAFKGCTELTSVELAKSVTDVKENAFSGCTLLEYVSCEDFSQVEKWSDSWNGNEEILIKSEQKNGLSAFEIYLLAMQTMQNKIDRYTMDVIQKTDVYLQGMLIQSASKRQYYECVLNDVYSYQNDGQSEMKVWYVGGIAYLVQNGLSYKMEASPEYFRDYSNQMMETLNVFEEKYFDNAEFYRNLDGTYTLVLVMSNENMADLVERVLGITDNSVNMTSCIYSYNFDANGYLTDMYADAEFSLSASGYTAYGVLDQDVVLTDVGTLEAVTQPQGNFQDVTNKSCTHPQSKQVTVKGYDATCTEDGLTEGIYCSNCFGTVKSSQKIKANGHNYENGKCTVCDMIENQSGGLYYEVSNDGKSVYLAGIGTFDGTTLVIPEKVFDIPVVGIKSGALNGSKIDSITMPSTIVNIQDGAFDGCTLVYAKCPTNLVKYLPESIENLTLTSGEAIAKNDFKNLTNLTMLTLKENIKNLEIADGAFENCTKLYVIFNFSSLEISLGDETSNGGIAKYAKMVNERVEDEGRYVIVGDFMFYQNGSEGYILSMWFGTGDTLVLPDSVNGETYTISRYIFEGNTDIVSLTIPVGIKIERYAFDGCTSIKYLTAESGNVSYVPKDSLTDIVILGEVITMNSLFGVKNLSSITIPSSVKSIETGFNSALSEESVVYYLGTLEDWCKIEFRYYDSNPMNRTANVYIDGEIITNLVIPESITEIKDYAFYNSKTLTSVIISNNVLTIGEQAFCECDALTGVTIGESVVNIGTSAFKYCPAITEINFNATAVQDLGDHSETFGNAGKQTAGINVTIGKNVTRIPASLFYVPSYYNTSSANIVSVTFEDGSVCQSIGNTAFSRCESLTSVILPNGLTSIGDYAFYECKEITGITIPKTVTSIGEEAFYYCNKIENANIPTNAISFISKNVLKTVVINGGTEIPDKAFYNCSSLTSIELPDSITSIGEYAFYYCKITSIEIPSAVTSIGKYAFGYCSKLTSVTFANTNGWYITETKGATNGTAVDVTDAVANATMLKTYTSDYYYWYKK